MCSNFEGVTDTVQFAQTFDVGLPLGGVGSVWPGYASSFSLAMLLAFAPDKLQVNYKTVMIKIMLICY